MAEKNYWDFLQCKEGARPHRHGDVRIRSQREEASWSEETMWKPHAAVAACYNPGAWKWSKEEWSNAAATEWSKEEWDAWRQWEPSSRSLDENGNAMGDDGATNNNSDVEQREQAPQDKSANEEIHKERIVVPAAVAAASSIPQAAATASAQASDVALPLLPLGPPPVRPPGAPPLPPPPSLSLSPAVPPPPPLPPQQASSSQQTPQSRGCADDVAAQQCAVAPGLADNDWNHTLDRIQSAKAFDARFYKELFAVTRPHGTYQQHNAAAKWLREICNQGNHSCLEMSNDSAVAVKPVQHTQGTSYGFLMDEDAPWIWHEMIGQLEDASIDLVCSVPLVRCHFAFRGKQRGPTKQLVWDFRVHRQDGTVITLHPEWTQTKFQGIEFPDALGAAEHLAAVTTHSANAKRCAHFRNSLGNVRLKFDPKKQPPKSQ